MLKAVFSVLAAMFGVQSSKNSERDLNSGKLRNFICAGIICLVVFILSIYCLVKLILMKNGI
jgi:heme/copper-type cytochrome/quinol oxidase subunit 2